MLFCCCCFQVQIFLNPSIISLMSLRKLVSCHEGHSEVKRYPKFIYYQCSEGEIGEALGPADGSYVSLILAEVQVQLHKNCLRNT